MLRQRFSFVSVTAMIIATALVIFLTMINGNGASFAGQRGFPFAWFWWRDFGPPDHGYNWIGLAADIIVWFVIIIAFGLFVERITQRLFREHEHRHKHTHEA